MNHKALVLRNVGSNWVGLGVTVAVGFFLSPFILHTLGNDAFGLWVLVFSITGYYGLFDLGIRSSIIKYVAKYAAIRDYDGLARLVNTSLCSYGGVAAVLLVVTGVGAWYVDSIFRVPPAFLQTARLLFVMVGAALALGFPMSVFKGVLQGLQEFHWLNLTQIVCDLLRALLIVIALSHGRGLLTVALITVALPLLASCVHVLIVRRRIPISFGLHYVHRASFHQMISYGAVTFMIMVADQLRFASDAIVIGIFLSVSAVTYFSIAAKLVDYANNVVDSMAETFLPLSSRFDATGDLSRMRRLFIDGNRACAIVLFPICAMLIVRGRSIIDVWVGPEYESSYVILVLLIVSRTAYRAQGASNRILFGMARHKPLGLAVLAEGAANLVLSILLVRHFGIVGVALGTAIPLLCLSLFFLPYYHCRLLGVRLRDFVRHAYGPALALCVPLVAALLVMERLFDARTYLELGAQLLAAGTVYGAGVVWFLALKQPIHMTLKRQFTNLVQQALSR